jgi:hypothetical protein
MVVHAVEVKARQHAMEEIVLVFWHLHIFLPIVRRVERTGRWA